jgi:hypothetical protein
MSSVNGSQIGDDLSSVYTTRVIKGRKQALEPSKEKIATSRIGIKRRSSTFVANRCHIQNLNHDHKKAHSVVTCLPAAIEPVIIDDK